MHARGHDPGHEPDAGTERGPARARAGPASDYSWRRSSSGHIGTAEHALEHDAWRASDAVGAHATSARSARTAGIPLGAGRSVDAGDGPVTVHDGPEADRVAHLLDARAFVLGGSIGFRRGHLDTGSPGGRALIRHETAHVGQQAAWSRPAVQRDATNQSLTEGAVQTLDDGELVVQLQLAEQMLMTLDAGDDTHEALSSNVRLLRAEYGTRDPARNYEPRLWSPVPVSTSPDASRSPIPDGGTEVDQLAVVMWDGEPLLRLRSAPDTSTDDNIVARLPFSTTVQVLKEFPGDWYFVTTPSGAMGYAAKYYFTLDPPEPNARLHRVEAGLPGFAISIAGRYYGSYADDWGQDLRFYVNVLAWANGIDVPNTTDGWRHVQFRAGQFIWVPSQPFAISLKGVVGSGSLSYDIAAFFGVADFIERIGQLWDDFKRALSLSRQYIIAAIITQLGHTAIALVEGLVVLIVGAAALLAITTAIGAAIGALAGGVGAAPGAAAGFEVGLALLQWIGLAMLVYWIGESLISVGGAFGVFLGMVWDASGDEMKLDAAARQFASALALLIGKLLEALFMYVTAKGLPKLIEGMRGTRAGEFLTESAVARWVAERGARVESGQGQVRSPGSVFGQGRTGQSNASRVEVAAEGRVSAFHEIPGERLPGNLPEGHFWARSANREWVLLREAGAPEVPIQLKVYSDGTNTNFNLRSGDRVISADTVTRTTGTFQSNTRLPSELADTGARNPWRSQDGVVRYDKGHLSDFADTIEAPGVRRSTYDPANFAPQAPWWNQGPRNTLVRWIRDGHPATGRPGGGGYREMAIYDTSPIRLHDGTPVPQSFVFVETTRAGQVVNAWRVPNDPALTARGMATMPQYQIAVADIPAAMIRPMSSLQPRSSTTYLPGVVFGQKGDDEE